MGTYRRNYGVWGKKTKDIYEKETNKEEVKNSGKGKKKAKWRQRKRTRKSEQRRLTINVGKKRLRKESSGTKVSAVKHVNEDLLGERDISKRHYFYLH